MIEPENDIIQNNDTEFDEPKGPPFGMSYRGVFDIKPNGVSKPTCVAVYNVMTNFAYGKKYCPKICRQTQERIAKLVGLNPSTVGLAQRELRKHGDIIKIAGHLAGSFGTQYEIAKTYMYVNTQHMPPDDQCENSQHAMPDIPTSNTGNPNRQGWKSQDIIENLQKTNTKPTKEEKRVVCESVKRDKTQENPKWREAADGLVDSFVFHCTAAARPDADEVYDAVAKWDSWVIKSAIEKCDKNTKTWQGVLFHLANSPIRNTAKKTCATPECEKRPSIHMNGVGYCGDCLRRTSDQQRAKSVKLKDKPRVELLRKG